MKKIILSFLLLLIVVFVYPQRDRGEVTIDILRNNPDSLNNKIIYANIAVVDGSRYWVGFSGGIGAYYNYENKFVFDFDIRTSYLKPRTLETKFDFSSSKNHEPEGGIKRLFNYDLTGYYLLGKFFKEGTTKVVLESYAYSTTYTKVRHMKYYSFPLRLGFGHHRTTIFNDDTPNESIELKGYDIWDPNQAVRNIKGSAIYSNYTLNLGVGLFEITDLKVKVKGDYQGIKDISMATTYYFDFMIPLSQSFSDMIVEVYDQNLNRNVRKQFHIDKHTTKTPIGFRFGYKYYTMKPPIGGGSKVEFGVLPGPHNHLSNIYVSLSIFVGFSPK